MSYLDWVGKLFNFFDKKSAENLSNYDIAKMVMDKVEELILTGENIPIFEENREPMKASLWTKVCNNTIIIPTNSSKEISIIIRKMVRCKENAPSEVDEIRYGFHFDGVSLHIAEDSYENLIQAFEFLSRIAKEREEIANRRKIIDKISKLK